jgi:hypothetical protein
MMLKILSRRSLIVTLASVALTPLADAYDLPIFEQKNRNRQYSIYIHSDSAHTELASKLDLVIHKNGWESVLRDQQSGPDSKEYQNSNPGTRVDYFFQEDKSVAVFIARQIKLLSNGEKPVDVIFRDDVENDPGFISVWLFSQ